MKLGVESHPCRRQQNTFFWDLVTSTQYKKVTENDNLIANIISLAAKVNKGISTTLALAQTAAFLNLRFSELSSHCPTFACTTVSSGSLPSLPSSETNFSGEIIVECDVFHIKRFLIIYCDISGLFPLDRVAAHSLTIILKLFTNEVKCTLIFVYLL